jgi:hypothetical protein
MQPIFGPMGPPDVSMPRSYAEMVRTTIRLDDALLARVKAEARRSGRTLTRVIEDAVRESLARTAAAVPGRQPVVLPTFRGGGPLPGVHLDGGASLAELMDGDGPR